jgi:glycosyltransferase involved in cell wall biosynthesis
VISIVLSFRNEAENIPTLVARLDAVLSKEPGSYEIIFVNDASTDASLAILLNERERNPRVKILNMSRRFGVSECVLAGLAAAAGDAVVYMDADLQDPPEVIPDLIARWRAGADIVHTVRTRRKGESALKMWATRVAYRIIQYGSSIELAIDAGDFKLLSRKAVEYLLTASESDPYLRGLVVWLGFNQAFVPYVRDARHAGSTHFPFFSRNPWKTFTIGLTSFSFMPIYLCVALAATGLLASFGLLGAWAILAAQHSTATLRVAALAALTFFWATTIGAIAVVGIYVIRIYKDVRRRPAYIIQDAIGIERRAR